MQKRDEAGRDRKKMEKKLVELMSVKDRVDRERKVMFKQLVKS